MKIKFTGKGAVLLAFTVLAAALWTGVLPGVLPAADGLPEVYAIPLEGEIEEGLVRFIQRAYREAEADPGVKAVILEISTPGGRVDSAQKIRKIIEEASVTTVALVNGNALSAGAYVALACDRIAMMPGSVIGDAEPRVGDERADEKILSAWVAEMAAVAEAHGRDPDIARAMVDRDFVLEGVSEAGKLLTLTDQEAKELGYADYLVGNINTLTDALDYGDVRIRRVETSVLEQTARFLTRSYVAPFLLMIGLAGIVIEVLTVGFGIAGIIGILSLCLYFGGYMIAGFTEWEIVLLFIAGVILLGVEACIPGFGIFGIAGIGCMAASIVMVAPSWQIGIQSLAVALLGTFALVLLSLRFLTRRKFWNKIILNLSYGKEEGYVAQRQDYTVYEGRRGKAYTPLRPAGAIVLDDNTRLDVVTDGDFIEKGADVVVLRVEGMRIIVGVR
ncbi:MAG: ATP-dependent Clp protease proteolytic subunit [Peptococcaceae bacterium]|nr:ATP-dependent Clp protease proteolytic subunit [Peptococcaceae bacterium]